MIEAALDLAERGLFVFPCKEHGKTPLTADGFLAATRDAEQIRTWWEKRPNANIGIACGASNLVVIDIDPRHGGEESFSALRAAIGDDLEAVTALTGGGGQHLYFCAPAATVRDNNTGALGSGIDVKSAGGYVIAPPSVHESGNAYAWEIGYGLGEIELRVLPDAIVQRLLDAGKRVAPQLADTEEIPAGKRDSTLASFAGTMRRRGADYDEIYAAIAVMNERRCKPPLPESDLQRIAQSISRYEPATTLSEPRVVQVPAVTGVLRFDDLAKRSTESVDWFYEGLLRRGGILLMAAQPKVGKSELARNAARATAMGTEFLGRRSQKGRVLWIGLEEPMSHLHERIEIMGMQELDIVYVIEQPQGDEAAWLRSTVETYAPAFVIIDTIGRYSKIENVNDYSQVARATQPILDLRSRLGTTFCLVHHNNHANKTLGSTMWEGVVDTIMSLSRNPDGTRFVQTKQRSGIDLEPTVLTMDQDTGSITCSVPAFIADQRVAEKRILEHLRTLENVTREDLARVSGRKVAAGRSAVDALVAAGLIRSQGTGAKGNPRLYSIIGSQGRSQSLVPNNGLFIVEDSEESEPSGRGMLRGNPGNSEDSELSEDYEDSEETWPTEHPGDLGDC